MHQAVLVNPDVDEGAEGRDVGHHALQHHAGREIVQGLDSFLEHGCLEGRARIATRLLQFPQDIGHGRQAECVIDEGLGRELAKRSGISDQVLDVALGCLDDPPYHGIGFWMNTRGIEGVVAIHDAQEPGALLERLGS